MKLGSQRTNSRALRGHGEQAGIVCALALALAVGCMAGRAWSEPLTEKDRFAKVGGPVSENIDIDKIKALLKSAKGISLVDKIELRRDLTTFTEEFYKFHNGKSQRTLAQLRTRFEKLHREIVALLSPENPQLSGRIERARGALWSAYTDREAFTSTVGREVVKDVEGDGAGLVGQRYEAAPAPGSGALLPPAKKVPEKAHRESSVKP